MSCRLTHVASARALPTAAQAVHRLPPSPPRSPAAGLGAAAHLRSAACLRGALLRQQRASPLLLNTPRDSLRVQSKPDRSIDRASSSDKVVSFPALDSIERYYEPVKEDARQYRRTVFDFEKWREHRSTKRYARHIKSIKGSRMVRGLAAPLLWLTAVAAAVATFNTLVEAGLAPDVLPELKFSNNGPFGLTSFALSLLLVFRTNASYARWLDARKNWGTLTNRSRDLTRQALTFFPAEDPALFHLLCRWVQAYSRSLMCHLRDDVSIEEELPKALLPYEVEAVLASRHRPLYCLQMLSEIVRAAHVPPAGQPPAGAAAAAVAAAADPFAGAALAAALRAAAAQRMDENLSIFEDVCGTCERILRAPIPLSYTRHTSRFMTIYLSLLPFTLWDSAGWAMVPLIAIVAFLLLGIEEIGVSIEEPFSILPLEQMCDTIQASVVELRAINSQQHEGSSGDGGNGNGVAAAPRQPPSARALLRRGVAEAAAADALA